jgi:hypothetical protein
VIVTKPRTDDDDDKENDDTNDMIKNKRKRMAMATYDTEKFVTSESTNSKISGNNPPNTISLREHKREIFSSVVNCRKEPVKHTVMMFIII